MQNWLAHGKTYAINYFYHQQYYDLKFIIALNSAEISTKEGLSVGSVAQHRSIKAFHAGSHQFGMAGRRVLLTIPPSIYDFYRKTLYHKL